MEIAVLWVLFSIAVGYWASKKGRGGFRWGLLALFVSPLIAAVFLAIAGESSGLAEDAKRKMQQTHVRCPDCRELVFKDANKCKHCGTRLVPQLD